MVGQMRPHLFFGQSREAANLTLEQRHLLILEGLDTNQAGLRVVEKERGNVTKREGAMGGLHATDDSAQGLLFGQDAYFQRKRGLLKLLTEGTFKVRAVVMTRRAGITCGAGGCKINDRSA
jgi:hypothetical protein